MRSPCNAIVYCTALPVGKYSRSLREWDLDSECFSWRARARRNVSQIQRSSDLNLDRPRIRCAYPHADVRINSNVAAIITAITPRIPLISGFRRHARRFASAERLNRHLRNFLSLAISWFPPWFLIKTPTSLGLCSPYRASCALQFTGGNQRSVRPPLWTIWKSLGSDRADVIEMNGRRSWRWSSRWEDRRRIPARRASWLIRMSNSWIILIPLPVPLVRASRGNISRPMKESADKIGVPGGETVSGNGDFHLIRRDRRIEYCRGFAIWKNHSLFRWHRVNPRAIRSRSAPDAASPRWHRRIF